MGLNDRDVEGTWRYASVDKSLVYLKWRGNEPNGGETDDCVIMKQKGVWSDANCDSNYFVACKKYVGKSRSLSERKKNDIFLDCIENNGSRFLNGAPIRQR